MQKYFAQALRLLNTAGAIINPATKEKQTDVKGDGEAFDRQDADKTVGTEKSSLLMALDSNDQARLLEVVERSLKTNDDQTLLLGLIINELKAINIHLSTASDEDIEAADIT